MKERPWSPADDPRIAHYLLYLENERNASKHTQSSYLNDIVQFALATWGPDASPPFPWESADRFAATGMPASVAEFRPGHPRVVQRRIQWWTGHCASPFYRNRNQVVVADRAGSTGMADHA